jgi:hypothetical protein
MSESNGKATKKRFTKRKTQVVEIEDEGGECLDYTIKQMMGDDLAKFEEFRKPLTDDKGVPNDANAANAVADMALTLTLFGPDGKPVTHEFVNGLSVETKGELVKEAMLLTGGNAAAREAAKNA